MIWSCPILNLCFSSKRSSWAPQNDILGHPATRAYVTACGIHSVYEAAFHGVPMLGIPFHIEQLYNARRMAWMSFGLLLHNSPALRQKGANTDAEPSPFVEDDIVTALSDVRWLIKYTSVMRQGNFHSTCPMSEVKCGYHFVPLVQSVGL